MSYSRSPPLTPLSPLSQDDWLIRGHSKTYSTNSSRSTPTNGRSQSSTSNRSMNSPNFESQSRTYYLELKDYLRDILAEESTKGPHPQRIAARQKLIKLSNLQFHELSMDVYDETVRRIKNDKYLPFLPVKEDFHPKRNQARQKLATLPIHRFKDLASDVFIELGRRYPNIVELNNNYNTPPPIPQIPNNASQGLMTGSTNIIPIKGRMNVEDDVISIHSPALSTRSLVKEFNKSTTDISLSSTTSLTNNNSNLEKIKSDYEYQIDNMAKKIKQLQNEIDDLNRQKSVNSNDSSEKDDKFNQLQDRYDRLNEKYENLNREYHQQQEAVRNVKNETKEMLDEIRKLAQVNEDLISEKEKAENEIERLKEEARDWQKKFEKAQIEIRSLKASSIIELDHEDVYIKENFLQPTRNGIISKDYIYGYQASIDDLLKAARSSDPSQVIHVMKNILAICKSITEETEKKEDTLTPNVKKSLYDLKSRFSTCLSDLISAAKYHASGMGLCPVSLLDRSAGHLTGVVIELAKLLGMHSRAAEIMKPTKSMISSLDTDPYYHQDDKRSKSSSKANNSDYPGSTILSNKAIPNSHKSTNSIKNEGYNSSSRSAVDSSYSYKSNNYYSNHDTTSRQNQRNNLTPTELVNYLQKETDHIVETIQSLLAALRLPQQNGEAYGIISDLLKIVATNSELSRATCEYSPGSRYRSRCEPILEDLSKCSQRIAAIQNKCFSVGVMATAASKRDLAREAYEIAKHTKELITLFES